MQKSLAGAFLVSVVALSGCGDDGSKSAPPATKPNAATATPKPSEPSSPSAVPASKPTQPAAADTRSPEELVKAGRGVYTANCIACHNMNPAEDGALGPAVAGSSLALLEARVLRGEYPEGHTPKRPSKIMVPLPHLEPKLPELAAYLASASAG
ncbi:MAG: c-type cytochrome [Myxococcota bacterium]